jgi:Ca2+-binding RTX toxin-like protein
VGGAKQISSHIRTLHGSEESTLKKLLNLEVLEARDNPSTIVLDGSTLFINASNSADSVQASYDTRGTWWTSDDQINVTLSNSGEYIESSFVASSVAHIALYAHDGNDYFVNASRRVSTAYGGNGDDTLVGGDLTDHFFGQNGNDALVGSKGDDNLYGGEGHDWISGDDGNDYLSGEAGYDSLNGGFGSDLLTGGLDGDYLDGGNDNTNDILYGDGGNDTFVQYHRRVWWWWTNEESLMDVGNGADVIQHVYVP